jgi:hypothetical protein
MSHPHPPVKTIFTGTVGPLTFLLLVYFLPRVPRKKKRKKTASCAAKKECFIPALLALFIFLQPLSAPKNT